jgi:hypothetical protein
MIFATIALFAALLTAQPASAAPSPYIVVLKSNSDVTNGQ